MLADVASLPQDKKDVILPHEAPNAGVAAILRNLSSQRVVHRPLSKCDCLQKKDILSKQKSATVTP